MILFIKLMSACVIIFPFSEFREAAASEPDLNLMVNYSHTRILDDGCHFLLESFANVSAKFTFCAISNARPITLCQDCIGSYILSLEVHKDILKLMDRAGELCKQQLLNLDRLQVVEGGFGFISGLWERAKCDSCYETDSDDSSNPKKLKKEIKEILRLQNDTDACIQNHLNDTENGKISDPKVCYDCKEQYLELNAYYNKWEVTSPMCMDIIDMVNTTRQRWSVDLGCCLDRKSPEYVFLLSSGLISVLPVLFYLLACTFTGKKEDHVVLLNKRCSIPYPGYVPPTPGPSEFEDDIPVCSSSSTLEVNDAKI